jgi:hypothetical protein
MSALSIRTNMRGDRRRLRIGPAHLAGIVIVLLATLLAILLGRGARPVGSTVADCANDTITLVASQGNDTSSDCEGPARAKSADSPSTSAER